MIEAAGRHSHTRQILRGSRLLQWWHAPPRLIALFEHAVLLRLFRTTLVSRLLVALLLLSAAAAAATQHLALAALSLTVVAAFFAPLMAVAALPMALIWSPRLPVLAMGDEILFLRVDHALVLGVAWHLAAGRRFCFRDSPVFTPFALFLATVALSASVGMLRGTAPAPAATLLYLMQWLHLGLILAITYALGAKMGPAGLYAWPLAVLSAAAYGLAEYSWPFYEHSGVAYRCYERVVFDGQANHFAGLFAFSTVVGLALLREVRWRALGLSLAVLSTAALVTTGSRTGVIAWCAATTTLAMLWSPIIRYTLPPLVLLGALLAPSTWWYRFSAPGTSMFDRLVAWKSALSTVPHYPLLGLGAGARHRSYYDNQYLMTLAESGALGLLFLLATLLALARALFQNRAVNGLAALLCTGTLAGLAGLAIHGWAAVTFIITVAAGPAFWLFGYALAIAEEEKR